MPANTRLTASPRRRRRRRRSPKAASPVSTQAKRCASKACSTFSPTRTGRRWRAPRRPTRTTWPRRGEPLRPLYDDTILFDRQPIALVLAEEWEIARFAASLVRVEYKTRAVRDRPLRRTRQRRKGQETREPRGNADKALAAAPVRHEAEYFIPNEHHNPMEFYARPRSGKATASSPSMTRPRACRTCSNISAASST